MILLCVGVSPGGQFHREIVDLRVYRCRVRWKRVLSTPTSFVCSSISQSILPLYLSKMRVLKDLQIYRIWNH